MWGRTIELALAAWLAISPFIFRYPAEATLRWVNDYACALIVIICSLTCYHRSLRKAHVVNIGIALWLVGIGLFGSTMPPPAWRQNTLAVGLLLGMFAIIPTDTLRPPRGWSTFLNDRAATADD